VADVIAAISLSRILLYQSVLLRLGKRGYVQAVKSQGLLCERALGKYLFKKYTWKICPFREGRQNIKPAPCGLAFDKRRETGFFVLWIGTQCILRYPAMYSGIFSIA
jgi:hypothetical protein